ncbi:non-homologous end-joining DNA ligase [Geodermatophilus sp. URMC 64]
MAVDVLPSWVEPELATLTHDRFSDPAWIFERKLDGERCLGFADSSGVRLMSRSRKEITATFPEVTGALTAQRRRDLLVDGEIVAFDGEQTRFERLQHRLGVVRPSEELLREVPVVYCVFDVLFADGEDVRSRPLLERKEILARSLGFDGPLRLTEHHARDGEALYAQACRDGWEGLIAKRADSPYLGGRTRDWLKFKCLNEQEFVIGGYTDPQRSRVGFGALLLGYYHGDDLVYAGKVGTGFDTATLRDLRNRLAPAERDAPAFTEGRLPAPRGVHWVQPRLVAQIGFAEWTDDGQLRQPRFLGLRDDKDPAEVIREVPE